MNELSINLMRLRKLNNLTQQDLADAASISRVAYRNLEKGDAEPREGTLQALAKALNVSALEMLAPLPQLKSLRYRANKNRSEQERAKGNQIVVRAGNWLRDFNELELMLGDKKTVRLKPIRKGTEPETAAANLRRELLGSDCGCVPDICELLEDGGVKILLCDFNMSELFGLSIGEADGGPAMAINTGKNISVERQIFSIAHELGPLMLHKDSYGKTSDELSDEQENEANRFAAAFLMPRDQFIAEWNENRGLHWVDAVLKTKRHFKVSYQAVLHQLIDMGKAEHPTIYKQFRADYEKRYGKKLQWKEEPPNDSAPPKNRIAGVSPASPPSCTAGVSPAPPPSRMTEEPRNLDPLDLIEDRLGSLVRDALDRELITVSRAAEILEIGIEEIRERMKSWEVVS
jgi:Zn-dependent peptidase ImmA (M78 family)/transcriptional regulator with XRE-family HTH domain